MPVNKAQREVSLLARLVDMSRSLGEPTRDYVVVGEGNTSAKVDAERFWVKASGAELASAGRGSFVEVWFESALSLLEGERSDAEIHQALIRAKIRPDASGRPS